MRIAIDWILKNRRDEHGKPFSHRSLSAKAGLSPAHLSNILAGRQGADIERPTAVKLAQAGNVRVEWLLTGQEPREPFDGQGAERLLLAPVSPPSAAPAGDVPSRPGAEPHERIWTTDQVEDWLLQAADKARHRGKHVNAVRRLLLELPTLMVRDPDMVGFAARALDAAATLDARDESLAPADILYEMTMTSAPRAPASPDGRSRWDEHGDRELQRHGVDPPGWHGGRK